MSGLEIVLLALVATIFYGLESGAIEDIVTAWRGKR